MNLNRPLAVYDLVDRPELKYPPFTPGVPTVLVKANIFEAISKQDILLHHPFESFAPVIDFVYRAATDPDVLAIKANALPNDTGLAAGGEPVAAAKAGKEVTVLIELRARFDEAANIELASKLQEAGAHVVYGVVGFKTHCKMTLGRASRGHQAQALRALGDGQLSSANRARLHRLRTAFGQ